MADLLLQLEGVRKSYNVGTPLEVEVLHGIDLGLRHGEFCALIGPSGSGKSTLLNLIGLLERPTQGAVIIDGVNATALDEAGVTRLRGQALGFVFQFHHLIAAFTAEENVYMPILIGRGRPDAAMRARAHRLLERVGLAEHARKKPNQLSGGQQQRVAIARALATDPPLVLADEPTGNLDSRSADEAFALMREFNVQQGIAFLVVTHDPRLAARCDRVIELLDGRIVNGAQPAS
jgi:lipoprotein-releasing system ATP-binding protein